MGRHSAYVPPFLQQSIGVVGELEAAIDSEDAKDAFQLFADETPHALEFKKLPWYQIARCRTVVCDVEMFMFCNNYEVLPALD